MLELELPWPPSVNHYKKVGRIRRTKEGKLFQPRVNTLQTTNFYKAVWEKACEIDPQERIKFARSDTIMLEMYVELYPPDKRRRDVDNGLKVLLDSFMHAGLIKDDSQIARLIVWRKGIIGSGKVLVRLREYA